MVSGVKPAEVLQSSAQERWDQRSARLSGGTRFLQGWLQGRLPGRTPEPRCILSNSSRQTKPVAGAVTLEKASPDGHSWPPTAAGGGKSWPCFGEMLQKALEKEKKK